ncbi:patatin-like phospholipase family protein [Bacteroidales bacterium OttesenSCG-928-K03]|nr:patatin-like phospholipase family protein [Odoribacter sp. OttesenSCG-928-L07]MDL2241058.1 patatin-like phospholipase family protein [Bacteroidales bacterium OttesenSCG-928-K22]MDL2242591.1 patatin-like phospholipase family protein [Bacteroidales bacterium OttesenSCG-928-K03]
MGLLNLGMQSFGQQCDDKTVGVTFSGGGAKGLAYIGMLEVINKTGMPIQYISGTSIGSIIGGMIAIGYTPEYLEEIATNMDWMHLLGNRVSSDNLSFYEKNVRTNYFLTLPLDSSFNVRIPSGLLSGQRVEDLFTRLYSPYFMIDDFSKLPTPFFCIAIDLESGEPVELTKGYFPDAIKASMSIPIALIPKDIDNQKYIDGGFINNFPAANLKAKGVRTILGLDVQSDMRDPDSIKTVFDVMNQFMDMNRYKSNLESRSSVDLLIRPDVTGLNTGSFAQNQEIIRRGKVAAEEKYDELQYLADSLRNLGCEPFKYLDTRPLDSIYVESLMMTGLIKTNPNAINNCFTFKVPGYVKLDKIEETLENLRGTFFFKYVTYQLLPGKEGASMVLRFEEMSLNTVSLGFNFTKEKFATLMFNTTFRNIGGYVKGSYFTLDLGLSSYPYLYSTYLFATKKKFQPGVSLNVYTLPYFTYKEGFPAGKYVLLNTSTDLFLKFNTSINSFIKIGTQFETFSRVVRVSAADIFNLGNLCLTGYFKFRMNTLDNDAFPKKGARIQYEGKGIFADFSRNSIKPFMINTFNSCFSFTNKYKHFDLTYNTYIDIGISLFNENFFPYQYYLGSYDSQPFMNMIPFAGFKHMQLSGNNLVHFKEDLQFNFLKRHYLILTFGAASVHNDIKTEFIDFENIYSYIGLSYGLKISNFPIKLSLNKSLNKRGLEFYLSIGNFINP